MSKPQVKYFAEGAAKAAARANAARRNSMFLGVASLGVDDEDSALVVRQKRLAAHMTLAAIVLQLLSLIAWRSDIAIAVFSIPVLFATVGAFIWFGVNKDHTSLRWLSLASGFVYVAVFFVSESCMPITSSGGRVFAVVVPTAMFHIPAGGSVFATIMTAASHLVLYVLISILEGSLSEPCFSPGEPPVTDELAQVLVQQVLPIALACIGAVIQFRTDAVDAYAHEDQDAFAAVVLELIEEAKFTEAVTRVNEYVAEPQFVPFAADLALHQSVVQADQFRIAMPAVIAPAGSPAGSTAFLKSPKAGSAPRSPTVSIAHKEVQVELAEPATLTPGTVTDGLNKSSGHSRGSKHFVAFEEPAAEHISGSVHHSRRGSIESPRVATMEPPGHDGELPAPSMPVRRRASFTRRASMKNQFPMVRERAYVVGFSMPRLQLYLEKGRCSSELVRVILSQYRDTLIRATSAFDGKLLFTSFTDMFFKFESCSSATAAAMYGVKNIVNDGEQMTDPTVKETLPYLPFAVVINTDMIHGAVGVSSNSLTEMGWCEGEALMSELKHHLALSVLSPPVVLIAASIAHLVEGDFTFQDSGMEEIMVVDTSVQEDPHGLPLLRYSRAREAEVGTDTEFDLPSAECIAQFQMEYSGKDGSPLESGESSPPRAGSGSDVMADSSVGNPLSSRSQSMRPGTTGRRKRLSPEIMQMWRRLDVDGNGHLDYEEIKEVLKDLDIFMTEEEMRDFFHEVDRDGSGTISMDEFGRAFGGSNLGGASVIATIRKTASDMDQSDKMPLVQGVWKKYDSDGNGTLDADELLNVLRDLGITQSQEEVEWLVMKLDTDGNGKVDFHEFASLFSEDATMMKESIVKQRIQTVSRVMEFRASKEVFSTQDQERRERLIHLRHSIDNFMSPLLFLYITYNFGVTTYRCAMGTDYPTKDAEVAADMSLDIIYIVWIVLKLALLPRDVGGHVLYHRKDVLLDYFTSPEGWVDILTILPLDVVYLGLDDVHVSGTYGYYRTNKLLAMYHFDERFMLTTQRWLNPIFFRISNALVWFIMISHVFACGVLLLARDIGEKAMTDMVGSDVIISKADTRYLLAILWAFQTLAGQLRGDALPPTDEQLVLMLLAVLIGLPLFAALLAVIGNAVTVQTTESMFLGRIDSLRSYFSYAKVRMVAGEASSLELECIRYYRHLFETTGSLDITANPLDDIPLELSIQVTVETGLSMLRKVAIFESACENVEFVHEITTKMMPRVVEPGMVVMRKGERGTNMYFVTYGDFNVVVENVGVVFTMRKGNFFGEIALLRGVKRTATIVCDERRYANALTLEKRDFDEVLKVFPDCLSDIEMAAADRLAAVEKQEAEEKRREKEERAAKKAAEEAAKRAEEAAKRAEEAAAAQKVATTDVTPIGTPETVTLLAPPINSTGQS